MPDDSENSDDEFCYKKPEWHWTVVELGAAIGILLAVLTGPIERYLHPPASSSVISSKSQ
jgi:hypothetical protein